MSTGWRRGIVAVACVANLAAVPAAAQYSDGYKFLKAVKDKDGAAATKALETQGPTIVDARDLTTGEAGMHIVVRRGDLGWMAFLLQHGANPNVRDRDGETPLLIATVVSFDEGVRVLTQIGNVQIDAANRLGETPLLKAVQARNPVAARYLLDAGANPDAGDNSGNSPRSVALADSRGGPVSRLLKDAKAKAKAPVQGPVR